MSKNINVNPNFYKDGGREHTEGADKAKPHDDAKQQLAQSKKKQMQGKEGQPNFIPGEAPVGEPGRSSGDRGNDE
jgi:hypothetical protein